MTVQNLAIVFGPTLFSGALTAMADTSLQNRVRAASRLFRVRRLTRRCMFFFVSVWVAQAVETILEHYTDIFVDENEEA